MQAGAKKIRTAYNEIWFDQEGILWVRPLEMTELDLDEVKACFEIYEQLGCRGNNVLQLLDVRNSVTITKEARDYAARHVDEYFLASAVVSDSLSVRLLVNFFNFFYKQKVHFKMFGNEKEAIKWLREFKKT